MGITVRDPNGNAYHYNDARFVERSAHGYADLYTGKGGTWVAQVPLGWLVELRAPCLSTLHASPSEMVRALLEGGLREASAYDLAKLKAALRGFNAKRKAWR